MSSYQVKLAGRDEPAEGTLSFRFEKPAGFQFKAGQAVVLELLDPPPEDGQKRRTFSIVSAPFESTLAIATRMRDTAFERALRAMLDGAERLRTDERTGACRGRQRHPEVAGALARYRRRPRGTAQRPPYAGAAVPMLIGQSW
jgi:hypothetical protein